MTGKTYIDNIYVPGINNCFIKWENGKNGAISDIDSNCILRFLETNSEQTHYKYNEQERKEKSEIVASGIVAWWLFYRRTEAVSDIFENYYQMRFKQYKDKREKEADSWKCNFEKEFLFNHCLTQEQTCVNTSQALFKYVSEEDGIQIQNVTNNYWEFVENKKLQIYITKHMDSEELSNLEYKILGILAEHGKEIDSNLKDSYQINDFFEEDIYTEAEIREASIDMQAKGWITCFIEYKKRENLGPAYWHKLLDKGRIALRNHIKKEKESQTKKTQKGQNFSDIVQGKDDVEKNDIIHRLHKKLDGTKGKRAAAILLKAKELKLIEKIPTEKEFESEFKLSGKWHSIATYLNPNKIVDTSSIII